MSLTTALNASLSGLKIVQEGIAVSANNLANVNTPGYVKQTLNQSSIVVGGIGQGVEISGISAAVDEQLLLSIQDQTSDLGNSLVLETYYDDIQRLFGNPNDTGGLNSIIDEFFTSFQNLSVDPQSPSLGLEAVNSAIRLTDKLSEIATSLHQLQLSADRQINSDISIANSLINKLNNSNTEIIDFAEGTAGRLQVEQQREQDLRALSEYIDISVNVDSDGALSVLTKNGLALLDSTGAYTIQHTSAASIDNFINSTELTAITVAPILNNGSISTVTEDLVSSGSGSSITSRLTSGNLQALVDLRDNQLIDIINQIDTLSDSIRNEVNAIHNDGASFPPPTSLTGTKSTTLETELGFSGKVTIAAIESDGTAIASPYSDEVNVRPLTLDFDALDSGNGAGRATVQDIINEINDYYGPPQNRAVVGNVHDIQLAAVSDSISNQGTFQFDLLLDNISTEGSTVVVQAVDIQDAGAYVGLTAPALPTADYSLDAGDRERTSVPFTVDFSGGPDLASYQVRVRVQVTDESGNVSIADIDYNISDSVSDIKNDKYIASNVSTVSGTSSFIIPAPTSQRYLTASLVDSNGNAISNSSTSGFLNIETNTGKSYGVAIDELDSQEVGLPSTPSADVTGKGFSSFFELNDLFVSNGGDLSGSALNLEVRSDIVEDPSILSRSSLTLSNQPSDATEILYSLELGSGDNSIATALAELDNKSVVFAAAGGLPAATTTISGYTSNLISLNSSKALDAVNNAASEQTGLNSLIDLFQKSAGVSTDEELALIVELENNYNASARIISVVKDLLQTLTDTLR